MDLGARPVRVFFDVTLPVIAPALVAGWLLAFTLSLDDLVIASFVTGPGRLDAADGDLLQGAARGQPRHQRAGDDHHRASSRSGSAIASWQMRRSARRGVATATAAFRAAGRARALGRDDLRRGAVLPAPALHPRPRRRRRGGDGLSLRRRRHLPARLPARAAGDPRGLGAARRAQGVSLGVRSASRRWRSSTAATPCSTRTIPETRGAGDRGGGGRGDRRGREAAGARRRPFHRLAAAARPRGEPTGRWRWCRSTRTATSGRTTRAGSTTAR